MQRLGDRAATSGQRAGARTLAWRIALPGLASAAAIALAIGGCRPTGGSDQQVAVVPICSVAQAISADDLHGTSLPAKTLSLSFDDGPGARTAELSAYLNAEGIRSSFFVNGMMLGGGTAVLQQIVADGHAIGNHTQSHASLTGRSTGKPALTANEVVGELSQTDALIGPFVGNRFMFRAPFGDFDAKTAAAIESSSMRKYVGPINWEIGDHMGPNQAADWDCWTTGSDGVVLTPEQCGDLYLKEIDSVGRGIILLHDPYFVDDDPSKGGTVDMVKYIVPTLKAKGYEFVRIDEVAEIASLLPPVPPAPVDAGTTPTTPGDSGDAGLNEGTPTSVVADANAPDPCAPTRR